MATRFRSLPLLRVDKPGGATSMRRTFVASTEGVASDRGIIRAAGWRFNRYASNPVFLWVHRRDLLPIGRGVGWRVDLAAREMLLDVEFPPAGVNDFADKVRAMFDHGFLRTVSVSWDTLREGQPTPDEERRGARWVSEEQELLELSAVPVPADTGAVDVTGSGRADRIRSMITDGDVVDLSALADTLRAWSLDMVAMADDLDGFTEDAAPTPAAHSATPPASARADGGGAQGAPAEGGTVEPTAPAAVPAALVPAPLLAAAHAYARRA